MAQISYTNKEALNENPEIANINKITDDDMNEIKQVVNDNYNNTIQITDTEPTDSDNKIWIDTGEVSSSASEITNEYSTSTGLGYSANYINNLHTYSTQEQRIGTWMGKPLYRRVFETTTLGSSEVIVYTIVNEQIKKIEGWIFDDNGFVQPYGSYQNDTTRASRVFCDGSYIKVQQETGWQSRKARVIVEYTKTTD